MSHHVLGDGRFGDLDTEFEQLAVNARCTPHRIVSAYLPDQVGNFLRHGGAPGLPTPDFPSPKETKALAMPSYDCIWFDDQQSRSPVTPDAP